MHYDFKTHLLYFGGWFRQTQKDSFEGVSFDSYCINRLYCSFPLALLIFIYSMIGLLICKYEPFWQDVSVESLILKWPVRSMGFLFYSRTNPRWHKVSFGDGDSNMFKWRNIPFLKRKYKRCCINFSLIFVPTCWYNQSFPHAWSWEWPMGLLLYHKIMTDFCSAARCFKRVTRFLLYNESRYIRVFLSATPLT